VHRPRIPLYIVALVAFASTLACHASAQQKCSDETIVARATDKDRGEAFKNADLAWEKDASARLGTKVVYHVNPRAKCASSGGAGDYTCTVSAKACTNPPQATRVRRASSCHVSAGGCEICCFSPTLGETVCHPQCK
jgi:hypothetical protein